MTLVKAHDLIPLLAKALTADDGTRLHRKLPSLSSLLIYLLRLLSVTPIDLFLDVIGESCTTSYAGAHRVIEDWEHVFRGLRAIDRSVASSKALYIAALLSWERFGASRPAWEAAIKRYSDPSSDVLSFQCHWRRCPLHEISYDDQMTDREGLRCTRCDDVGPRIL